MKNLTISGTDVGSEDEFHLYQKLDFTVRERINIFKNWVILLIVRNIKL